jgi:hypothetical protein
MKYQAYVIGNKIVGYHLVYTDGLSSLSQTVREDIKIDVLTGVEVEIPEVNWNKPDIIDTGDMTVYRETGD